MTDQNSKIKISIIAAIGPNRELGKNNRLLWNIPEDLKRFKKLTQGHAVIMGRKTFESLGKPLSNRLNIIITHNRSFKVKGCFIYYSLKEALNNLESRIPAFVKTTADRQNSRLPEEVFIIGGGQIYEQAIKMADKLYLTIVEAPLRSSSFEGQADTFFPDYSAFKKVLFKETHTAGGYTFTFLELSGLDIV